MQRIVAISAGRIAPLFGGSDGVVSAIKKTPLSTLEKPLAVHVGTLGVEGDEQADKRVHGGARMAVYLYPVEHYPVWQTMRQQALKVDAVLPFGFMGENLSIEGLLEHEVYVGDQIHIGARGGVVLVVTKPRVPCFKFNAQLGFRHAAKMMTQSAYTGWYCAVFRAGHVCAGDPFEVVPGERAVRVDELHRMALDAGQDELF